MPDIFYRCGEMKYAIIIALLIPALTSCQEQKPAELSVSEGWTRPTVAAGQVAAVYLTIENPGAQSDRLISVSTGIGSASLHETSMTQGVMRMRPVAALDVPANGSVKLAPGGKHIMIEGLRAPLREKEAFTVKLGFVVSGDKDVRVTVAAADAAPEEHEH